MEELGKGLGRATMTPDTKQELSEEEKDAALKALLEKMGMQIQYARHGGGPDLFARGIELLRDEEGEFCLVMQFPIGRAEVRVAVGVNEERVLEMLKAIQEAKGKAKEGE